MKKQITFLISAMMLGLLLSSCSNLKSEYYPGEAMTVSEEDQGEETIWMHGGSVYHVKQVGSNSYVIATVGWEEKAGEYKVKSCPIVPSQLGDHMFISIKDTDLYTIFRVGGADDHGAVLYSVDKEKMKQAIADGKAKARMEDDNIILEGSKEEQDEYIKNNIDSIFSTDSAHIVTLLHEEKKDQKKASPDKEE